MIGPAKRNNHSAPTADVASADISDSSPGLDRVIQAQIGDKLRTMYGELIDQPVPDRLADIINQLGQSKRS